MWFIRLLFIRHSFAKNTALIRCLHVPKWCALVYCFFQGYFRRLCLVFHDSNTTGPLFGRLNRTGFVENCDAAEQKITDIFLSLFERSEFHLLPQVIGVRSHERASKNAFFEISPSFARIKMRKLIFCGALLAHRTDMCISNLLLNTVLLCIRDFTNYFGMLRNLAQSQSQFFSHRFARRAF